jgi:CDGSH-type Zn-finger protein
VTIPGGGPESGGSHGTYGAEEMRAALAQATQLCDQLSRAVPGPVGVGVVADRLAASVVRPLTEALALVAGTSPSRAGGGPPPGSDTPRSGEPAWGAALWQLTRKVTGLAVRQRMPAQVREAAAALQDLVWQISPAEGPGSWAGRLAALKELQTTPGPVIEAALHGPYLVTGVTRLTNWLGEELPARPQMALCRYGASAIKPLCDGTHARIGFTSAKDPGRAGDPARQLCRPAGGDPG